MKIKPYVMQLLKLNISAEGFDKNVVPENQSTQRSWDSRIGGFILYDERALCYKASSLKTFYFRYKVHLPTGIRYSRCLRVGPCYHRSFKSYSILCY
jgi:hypothetical protein